MRRRRVSLGGSARYPKLAPGAEDGTPERLARAARTGSVGAEAGVRRLADPFDVLRNRGLLDRSDPVRNRLLWEAGERFRRHWHGSGIDGLAAFDFLRDSVDVSRRPDAGTPAEAALRHRESLRRARSVVGTRLMPVLTGLVVEARPVAALRFLVTDTSHARTADALILERLREALHRLGEHWHLLPEAAIPRPREGGPVSSWSSASVPG